MVLTLAREPVTAVRADHDLIYYVVVEGPTGRPSSRQQTPAHIANRNEWSKHWMSKAVLTFR